MSKDTIYYNSPAGIIEITATGDKITSISFTDAGKHTSGKETPILKEAIKQLYEYFAGTRKEFDIGLDMNGTDFQREVWYELMQIPYGTTVSYSQLAQRIGNNKAVRAVANAVAANKLAIIVPCHRIIGKDGGLTGYKWGIERKKQLLEHKKGK